jgi:FtsP/CotA-like multicopper oxidase with cupredoxin domain
MSTPISSRLDRRRFLVGSACAGLLAAVPGPVRRAAASAVTEYTLKLAPGLARIAPSPHPETAVWAFNGSVPGPEIRVRQGETLRVTVENGLAEETTIHWHGLRIPHAMDGVPHLTQKPIAPGGRFVYEFAVPDAGTYWYHPHQRSSEQVGRGLYGPLIVEEPGPVAVDRDLTWVLDDWRLTETAEIQGNFGNMMDASHNGRIGNTVTLNGTIPDRFTVRGGERIRLRLINAANARVFGLEFTGHEPKVIAIDGQPVQPHPPDGGRVVLGPAMRTDLIIDMTGKSGESFSVRDGYYRNNHYRLLDLAYGAEPLRDGPPTTPIALTANPLPEPDIAGALRHEVVFAGGMMGAMTTAMMGGRSVGMRDLMQNGLAWTVNGVAATGHVLDPMVTVERGRTCVLVLKNDTAWEHPMHLHGHSFRVLSRKGAAVVYKPWQDTVLVGPEEKVEVAFVADNPGDWMFHCHILEHQEAGMSAILRVT